MTGYYNGQLVNDPQLQATLQGLAALQQQYQAGLQGQVQQAVEQYGAAPAGLTGSLAGYIDPTTVGLAQQGTQAGVTTVARLAHAYDLARQGSLASLAARGMLHSGAIGQHENENLRTYHGQQFDALQQLLQGLHGYQDTYLGQQAGVQQQREQATNDALGRIISRIQTNPTPPPGGGTAAGGSSYRVGGLGSVAGAGGTPRTAAAPSLASAQPKVPNVQNTLAAVKGGATVLGF